MKDSKERKTKNGNGEGSICQVTKTVTLANGKVREHKYWEVKISTIDPNTGKKCRKSYTAKTRAEAIAKKDKATAEIVTEGYIFEPSTMTLSIWIEEWIGILDGKLSYNSVETYKSRCRSQIIPQLGDVKLSRLNKLQIQKFVDRLSKICAPKTVRNTHGVLVKCLEDAVYYGMIKNNPANGIKLPAVVKGENAREIEPLTETQIKEFLAKAEESRFCTLIKLILFTGLRESEAIGLTWDSIDFQRNTITVKQQLQRRDGKYTVVKETNSKKKRVITVAPYVISLLEQVKISQTEEKLRAGENWQGWKDYKERETALVFTNEYGRYIIHMTLYHHVKKIFKEMGIPNHTVHDLRHEFAVISLQNGDDIKTVQGNLGHATASFTLDVYGHISEKMKEESASRMQAYIEAVS